MSTTGGEPTVQGYDVPRFRTFHLSPQRVAYPAGLEAPIPPGGPASNGSSPRYWVVHERQPWR